MLKIKVSIGWNFPFKSDSLSIYNFTNSKDNTYNNKKFFINTEVEDPDYWFIVENTDSTKIEKVKINKDNIIFLGSDSRYEPSYFLIKSKQEFLSQFDTVYSHTAVNLKNSFNEPSFCNWKLRGDPFENKFKESRFIEQVMVVGEGEKMPAAFIQPTFDFLKVWCQRKNITYTTNKEMVENERAPASHCQPKLGIEK